YHHSHKVGEILEIPAYVHNLETPRSFPSAYTGLWHLVLPASQAAKAELCADCCYQEERYSEGNRAAKSRSRRKCKGSSRGADYPDKPPGRFPELAQRQSTGKR